MTRAIDVAVSLPRLELDRPFTYLLPDGAEAPLGSVVSVKFHGRTVHGYVLGDTEDVPERVLPISRVLSARPLFDERGLRLARAMAERYVTPLAVALGALHPPRVASEETRPAMPPVPPPPPRPPSVLRGYEGGAALREACREGSGGFALRPLPAEEGATCVEAVSACLAGGRDAVVVVPEAEPLPATARAVLEAFGDATLLFAGGDRRARYRAWLDVLGGRYRVVVGTRAAVFALLPRLGLVWVHREAHAAHREARTPAYHSREVALARVPLEGVVCVLAGLAPGAATAAAVERGSISPVRPPRSRERAAAPVVETAPPEREDRSRRLTALLKGAPGAFLLLSRAGYGVARRCRACGEPARCEACSGPVLVREGRPVCGLCRRDGRCASCGAADFGVERGGTERLAEWAGRVTRLPVRRVEAGERAVPPVDGVVVVGTAAAVKDLGPVRAGLVGVLDADRARRRPGLDAPEQTLATWMEAAAWAGPKGEGGRVLVQTREPGDPAIQALIRWDPLHFHRSERARRADAGFPPGHPVYRVVGSAALPEALREEPAPVHLLDATLGDETVCLATVRPEDVSAFRARILDLIAAGVVTRVEAEPQI